MKHQRTFQFMMSIIVLFVLWGSSEIVHAKTNESFVVDTGIFGLPSTHELRITAAISSVNDTMTVAFRRLRYDDGTCTNSGICEYEIVSDDSSGPVTIAQDEAASCRVSGTAGSPPVRVIVLGNNRDVRVTAQLINQATGDIVAIGVPQGSPVVAKP